jgi:hypothetical protein
MLDAPSKPRALMGVGFLAEDLRPQISEAPHSTGLSRTTDLSDADTST